MYYVIAEVEEFEPVEQKIALGRGLTSELNLQLRGKEISVPSNNTRVVSVAELRQSVPDAARKEYRLD